jgi:8-oxo-dGTP pyrophosphatase MutT (NUDIX family)
VDLAPYRRRYGRIPLEHRDWPVDAKEFAKFAAKGREPVGAAVLVWDRQRRILLLRHRPETGWQDLWATPGGMAEKGETPEACAVRETREETGLEVTLTSLTKVIVCHVTHEARTIPYTFFQFEGTANGKPRPGRGIAEVAWVEGLPVRMHFRADYLEPWLRGRPRL